MNRDSLSVKITPFYPIYISKIHNSLKPPSDWSYASQFFFKFEDNYMRKPQVSWFLLEKPNRDRMKDTPSQSRRLNPSPSWTSRPTSKDFRLVWRIFWVHCSWRPARTATALRKCLQRKFASLTGQYIRVFWYIIWESACWRRWNEVWGIGVGESCCWWCLLREQI